MKSKLIINPLSGNGRSGKYLDAIIRSCISRQMEVDHAFARTYDEIKQQSIMANAGNYDNVVAVGGDGTINAVLNGFYDDGGKRISKSKFGVIYTGTSPDFCKSYHVSLDHDQAIKSIAAGKTIKMKPGMISLETRNGTIRQESRYFACCANAGIGAGIAREANRNRKYAGDLGGTFISLMKNLARYHSREIFLEIDHECNRIEHAVNISIGRTPFIASGIKIKNIDVLNKDLFYVLIASNISIGNVPGLLRQVYSGNIKQNDYLRLQEGKNIMLFSDEKDIEVEFDGDPAGYLPCSIRLADQPVDLIIDPEASYPAVQQT
jgi:diacylglycerol kinase family enzyme